MHKKNIDDKFAALNLNYIKIIVGLSILGSFVSAYLVQEHYSEETSVCDINTRISCSVLNKSAFSVLFGVPIAIFGILWYIVLIIMAVHVSQNDKDVFVWITVQFLWTVAGMGFVVYLLAAEIILGTLCPFCTIVHIIVTVQFYLSWKMFKGLRTWPSIRKIIATLDYNIIVFGAFFLLPLIAFNIPSQNDRVIPRTQMDIFARCITSNGYEMYGADGCSVCQRQKQMFKDSFQYITYRNCEVNEEECERKNIEAYPTWFLFDGSKNSLKRHDGLLTLTELEEFTGCKIPGAPRL